MVTLLFKFAVILLLFCPSLLLANGWQAQQSNTEANLRGVWFVDSLSGWACGDTGTILHTSNGGEDWELQESGVSVDLEDVFFWDMDNGWVVGDNGTILYTSNMGEHWTIQNTPVSAYLHIVQFITEDIGVALGNQVTLSTNDGGTTWVASSGNFSSFFWLDEYRGAYSFEYEVVYTIDGGMIWADIGVPLIPYDMWGYRDTIYSQNCPRDFYWVVGDNGVTDWIIIFECAPLFPDWFVGATPDSLDLKAVTVEIKASLRLWAVGESGWIISSKDSGKTWETSQVGTTSYLYEVSFPADGNGWAVGDSGTILHYWNPPVSVIDDELEYTNAPVSFELSQNYPNPFNPSTTIKYQLSNSGMVTLKVYDIVGREVITLVEEFKSEGSYEINFNTHNLSSGAYIYRIVVSKNGGILFIHSKQMLLMK
jgi:hypothetical protein